MENILAKFKALCKEDIEACRKGSIDAFERGELSNEHMERLARFTATNRQLKHHGLMPLPHLDGEVNDTPNFFMLNGNVESESLPVECEDLGITHQEYNALKGEFGTVLGITVSKYAYKTLMCKCRSKKAITMRQSEALAKRFMVKKMKRLAASIIRRKQKEEIIDSIKKKPITLIKT